MKAIIRQATMPPLHARAPQRPRRQGDAAGAGGGEQAGGRHARHGDLVALAPVDRASRRGRRPRGRARCSRGTTGPRRRRSDQPARVARARGGSTCPAGRRSSAARSTGRRPPRRRRGRTGSPPSRVSGRARHLLVAASAVGGGSAVGVRSSVGRAVGHGVVAHARLPPAPGPRAPAHERRRRAAARRAGRSAPHALGQREARREVDHVVLAQVDERDAERQRVASSRPRRAPGRSRPAHGRP